MSTGSLHKESLVIINIHCVRHWKKKKVYMVQFKDLSLAAFVTWTNLKKSNI